MPSILAASEYDIFINYCNNDNRSGWVTVFVKTLQDELAATIKEPLSVYFDTNPHIADVQRYLGNEALAVP